MIKRKPLGAVLAALAAVLTTAALIRPTMHTVMPHDGGTYPNAVALLSTLDRAGLPCGHPADIPSPADPGALTATRCNAAYGGDTVIETYTPTTDTVAVAAGFAQWWALGTKVAVVVGANWTIQTSDPQYAVNVAHKLGGHLILSWGVTAGGAA